MYVAIDNGNWPLLQLAIVDVEFCVVDGTRCTLAVLLNLRKLPS